MKKLGVENGKVAESQITVSSQLYPTSSLNNSRLNYVPFDGEPGAWVAENLDASQWIQVCYSN